MASSFSSRRELQLEKSKPKSDKFVKQTNDHFVLPKINQVLSILKPNLQNLNGKSVLNKW